MRSICFAITIGLVALPASQASALECAGGSDVMDAVLMLPDNAASVTEVDQYAWLGEGRLSHVCDLNIQADGRIWINVFSGEFRSGQGICMSYTTTGGATLYSCATPADIASAMAAPRDTPANTLRFTSWAAGLPAF
ncbi:MAG: hypothetical protein AAF376_02095 [Pseudomonadota bacterium]